jgi:hypothetical protein
MSNDKDKIEISPDTKIYIIDKLVEPHYKDMVKSTIDGKKCWRTLGIALETSSKIMIALGGIFSFSAGYYHDDTLSFVAGSISCMSLALLQIASFSYKENKKQGDELNILLKKLHLDTVPSMPRSEDQSAMMYSSARRQMPSEMMMSPEKQQALNYQTQAEFLNLNKYCVAYPDEERPPPSPSTLRQVTFNEAINNNEPINNNEANVVYTDEV